MDIIIDKTVLMIQFITDTDVHNLSVLLFTQMNNFFNSKSSVQTFINCTFNKTFSVRNKVRIIFNERI